MTVSIHMQSHFQNVNQRDGLMYLSAQIGRFFSFLLCFHKRKTHFRSFGI